MKKILTASLVAIMAVTAANADIASTKYVDNAKSAALATAATDAQSKADAALASAKSYADGLNTTMDGRVDNLEAANTTNKTDIDQLKEDVAGLGTGAGSVASQINNKVGDLGTYGTVVEAIAGEVEELADGAVATNAANIAKLNGDANTAGSVAKAVADAKTELQGKIDQKAAKATTLAGYGITDAYTMTQADGKFQTKANILTSGQVNGDTKKSEDRYVSAAAAEKMAQDAVGVLTGNVADMVAGMDADKSAAAGSVMIGVVQEDGVITEIKEAQITNAFIADNAAITKGKLATDVQTSLGLADNALPKSEFNSFKTTNTDAINAASAKGQQGIDAAADAQATADAAVAKTTIGAGANFAIPANCKTANAVCSLVVRAGVAGWEQVVDSATAAE